jgi:hypothetical protein
MLERMLIAELVIDDFDAAAKYVRSMAEEQVGTSGFLSLVKSSRRAF